MTTKKNKKKIDWKGIIDKVLNDMAKVDDKINVAVSMSVTINIGNYESLKYGIAASMDCKQEKADEVRQALEDYIESKLREKYKEVSTRAKTTEEAEPEIEIQTVSETNEIELEDL